MKDNFGHINPEEYIGSENVHYTGVFSSQVTVPNMENKINQRSIKAHDQDVLYVVEKQMNAKQDFSADALTYNPMCGSPEVILHLPTFTLISMVSHCHSEGPDTQPPPRHPPCLSLTGPGTDQGPAVRVR